MPAKLMVATLILAAAPCSVAQSQVTIDVAKISCDQYASFAFTDPNNIALWLSGYYHGQRNNTLVDTQQMKANAGKIKDYCLAKPNATVMQAVEAVFGTKK